MIKKIALIFIIILALPLFSSCSKKKDEKIPTVEVAYTEAVKILKEKRYSEAAEKFEKISDDYPLSKWSVKAQTMAAYAYYQDKKYDEVIKTTEDFIRSNPANDAVSYMQYMKALTYFELMPTIERGQNDSQIASYAFRELIARFPDSAYAEDARKKLIIVDEHLAGAKMSIGRYSIKTENYVGAIEYFDQVIHRYQNTNQAPEAYFRLVEVYTKLGMSDESKDKAETLRNLYPDNEWTKRLDKIKF